MNDLTQGISKATYPYLFQHQPLLAELPEPDLTLLRDHLKTEVYKRGQLLFRQGTYPKGVYWLQSGKIKIFQETAAGERQTLYIYSDGDLIGYRQFIAEEPNPVSATFLEDGVLALIPGEVFRKLLSTSPVFSKRLLTALAREFSVWMNRTTVFTKFPVRHRLILALLTLYLQYQRSGSPVGEITMTRTDLAEYVGASLETVVRSLNKLKALGLVRVKGRHISLPDTVALLNMLKQDGK